VAKPKSTTAWLRQILPLLVALGALGLGLLAVSVEHFVPIISLLLGILGTLGIFSPKTPIGRAVFIRNILADENIETFFIAYRWGLIYLTAAVATAALYLASVYINFFTTHLLLFSGFYFAGILSTSLLLIGYRDFALAFGLAHLYQGILVVLILVFGTSVISSRLVDEGRIEESFLRAKSDHVVVDGLMVQAPTMRAYASLYEQHYRLITKAAIFLHQYRDSHESYDLWGPINWASDDAYYVINEQTIYQLRTTGMPDDVLRALAIDTGRRFKGQTNITRYLKETLGDVNVARYRELVLQHTIDSKQKLAENTFKMEWQRYASVVDTTIVDVTRQEIESGFRLGDVRLLPLIPMQLLPEYLAVLTIEANITNFARLSAVSKFAILNIGLFIINQRWVIGTMVTILVALLVCYLISDWVKRYNLRYDPDMKQSNTLFFIVISIVSLVISFWTW